MGVAVARQGVLAKQQADLVGGGQGGLPGGDRGQRVGGVVLLESSFPTAGAARVGLAVGDRDEVGGLAVVAFGVAAVPAGLVVVGLQDLVDVDATDPGLDGAWQPEGTHDQVAGFEAVDRHQPLSCGAAAWARSLGCPGGAGADPVGLAKTWTSSWTSRLAGSPRPRARRVWVSCQNDGRGCSPPPRTAASSTTTCCRYW